jgi:hypothetical protein
MKLSAEDMPSEVALIDSAGHIVARHVYVPGKSIDFGQEVEYAVTIRYYYPGGVHREVSREKADAE